MPSGYAKRPVEPGEYDFLHIARSGQLGELPEAGFSGPVAGGFVF